MAVSDSQPLNAGNLKAFYNKISPWGGVSWAMTSC